MGLDTVEIVMEFEKAFGLEISDDAAVGMGTPREVQAFVVAEYARLGWPAEPEAILETILAITANYTRLKPHEISPDAHFVHDLGLD